MPRKTLFSSKWLLRFDNTGKTCSRWLIKGKTSNSFRCTVCNTDDLSCANGGWVDVKKHFDRPKHIQCMKDVFGSIPLVASSQSSSSFSNNIRMVAVFVQQHSEQKSLQEELTKATDMLEEGTTRLAAAMKNKKFDDIGTAEVLVTAANAKLADLKTKLIENNENFNRLRKKQKK